MSLLLHQEPGTRVIISLLVRAHPEATHSHLKSGEFFIYWEKHQHEGTREDCVIFLRPFVQKGTFFVCASRPKLTRRIIYGNHFAHHIRDIAK